MFFIQLLLAVSLTWCSFVGSPSLDLPATPGNPVPIRNTNTSVVVTWGASKEVKRLVGYYIECSQVGTDVWMPCNNKPVKETRSASFTLIRALEIQKS